MELVGSSANSVEDAIHVTVQVGFTLEETMGEP
ncbi:MAG: hypothetical protein ACYCZB_06285 [Acidiphilium sp.]